VLRSRPGMQLLHRLRVTPHQARPGETTAAAPAFATGRYDLTLSFADNESVSAKGLPWRSSALIHTASCG
jgi:hypothetical protein